MKSKLIYLFAFAVTTVSAAVYAHSARAQPTRAAFGACYTLYNCQGSSIGSFTDIQCRQFGGHSIDSGGVCINL